MKAQTAFDRITKLNINKGTAAYRLIIYTISNKRNIIRPAFYSGRGRYCSVIDHTDAVKHILDEARVKYNLINDAPRGSVTGNAIVLTHIQY